MRQQLWTFQIFFVPLHPMKTIWLFLASLLATLLMAGCNGRDYPPELVVLDSLADVNPDSACQELHRLNSQMMQASEPTRNYYLLLCIKAEDKADQPHANDSLIFTLVSYYENGGDPNLLPLAYYYAGRQRLSASPRLPPKSQ